jgi:hypothetical protein
MAAHRPDAEIDAAFAAFHRENPDVYDELVRLARTAKERGRSRMSMRMLWEVLRYQRTLQIKGDGEYRLNNNYTSRYARLIMDREPDLEGMFELRGTGLTKSKSADDCETLEEWLAIA